jgi:uncharacterized protein
MWLNHCMGVEAGFEWPATLDVTALAAEGWTPVPFREFIVKIHSRCDLACNYCYMYEMADQSWRDRPHRMSAEIASLTAMRIGEHARAHHVSPVTLVLHGGEPLLAGRELITHLVTSLRREAGPRVTVDVAVQTNGVGLNDSYLRLFGDLGVHIGVSVDGAPEDHDRHRRFPSGRGSYTAVAAGLSRLNSSPYRDLFSGLLATIDLRNDPITTYKALADFGPPKLDFLLPHGTWDSPPPGRVPGAPDTPYADWLIKVFDYWYTATGPGIRLFEEIMHLILGGTSPAEIVGLAPSTLVVIETDGAIEQGDALKAVYPGAPGTGLHVSRDPLDKALQLPGVVARQLGARALSAQCQACRLMQVCGGGLYAHRYRSGAGFANPSVYCPDLIKLIGHIRDTMHTELRP